MALPLPPQVASQSRDPEIDLSLWKIVVLAVLGGAAAVVAAYAFKEFLATGRYGYLWATAAAAVAFAVLVVLHALFIKSARRMRLLVTLECLAPLVVFRSHLMPDLPYLLLFGSVLLTYFTVGGAARGHRILSNSIKVHFFEISRSVVPRVATGVACFLSITFYLSYFSWGLLSRDVGISLLSGFLRSTESVLQIWYPKATLAGSVQEVLGSLVEGELTRRQERIVDVSGSQGPVAFGMLPDDAKAKIVAQGVIRTAGALEKTVGPLPLHEPLVSVLYQLLDRTLGNREGAIRLEVGAAATLLLFGFIRGIASLFAWLVELIAFLVFKLLVAVNFAYLTLESRSREFILLS